jgi:hypothetical protein
VAHHGRCCRRRSGTGCGVVAAIVARLANAGVLGCVVGGVVMVGSVIESAANAGYPRTGVRRPGARIRRPWA